MSGHAEKLRLADRAEAILRSDRAAKLKARQELHEPALLLTLVPDEGPVIDFMDAYLPDIADTAGLQYVRLIGSDLRNLPVQCLRRTFLFLADLTGRDETVITLVYEALSMGRRVMLAAQHPGEIPADLSGVPAVLYDLESGQFEGLLQAIQASAYSTTEDLIPLV